MPFEELKARQSAVWGAGPYEAIAERTADVHAGLIDALGPRPGERWLDVATGTGAVAVQAARAGADVTGVDLAPALVEIAGRRAREEGLAITFDVGDAEDLPYPDASFDVVVSAIGTMFTPDHGATARELARVTRPGGRLGLANWTPRSGVAEMFRAMAPFQPAPPPSNPFDWGREERVRELLGAAFELELSHVEVPGHWASGAEAWDVFSTAYGPTKVLAESLDPDRREELRRAFVGLFESWRTGDGVVQPREYLLVVGRRRA